METQHRVPTHALQRCFPRSKAAVSSSRSQGSRYTSCGCPHLRVRGRRAPGEGGIHRVCGSRKQRAEQPAQLHADPCFAPPWKALAPPLSKPTSCLCEDTAPAVRDRRVDPFPGAESPATDCERCRSGAGSGRGRRGAEPPSSVTGGSRGSSPGVGAEHPPVTPVGPAEHPWKKSTGRKRGCSFVPTVSKIQLQAV